MPLACQRTVLTRSKFRQNPPLKSNKLPSDGHRQLIACLQSIDHIFQLLELPVLTLDTSQTDAAHLTLGAVFVVASLIVSRLVFSKNTCTSPNRCSRAAIIQGWNSPRVLISALASCKRNWSNSNYASTHAAPRRLRTPVMNPSLCQNAERKP